MTRDCFEPGSHWSAARPRRQGVGAVLHHPHRAIAKAKALPDNGTPNGVTTPPAPGVPVPVVGHGVVLPEVELGVGGLEGVIPVRGVKVIRDADGFGIRATDGGLRPPPPSSVAPSGIPAMPTDDPGPIDEAIGAA